MKERACKKEKGGNQEDEQEKERWLKERDKVVCTSGDKQKREKRRGE